MFLFLQDALGNSLRGVVDYGFVIPIYLKGEGFNYEKQDL